MVVPSTQPSLRSSSKKASLKLTLHEGLQSIPTRATFGTGWVAAADAKTSSTTRMTGSAAANRFIRYRVVIMTPLLRIRRAAASARGRPHSSSHSEQCDELPSFDRIVPNADG